jgi:wyosine [tRNA(Phe)-imidazoG37] synthetase (radical SAM superfamily)
VPREYIYGPYPSRRLGLSLGVNVLPKEKTCTFDCVYCEIGQTEKLVDSDFRLKLPPSPKFEKELRDILKFFPHLDSITFGYNGEPTLNENLIDFYDIALKVREDFLWKKNPPLITLFTNSTTLNSRKVRKILTNFDLVLAKLDVATQEDYIRTNRPHPNLPEISTIIENLSVLSREMVSNSLTLQCLIYNSYRDDYISNCNEENIRNMGIAINKIKPNGVQIYSLGRIPSEYFVYSIDEVKKKQISTIFKELIKDSSIEIAFY